MDIWQYVQKHDFSSPENQIKLLVVEAQKISLGKKLKILDIGGGFKDRKTMLHELGKITTLDVQSGRGVDIVGNAHKLPFPDKSFDLVVLFMVLEHLENPEKAISEIARVLSSKGILLLTTVQYWHSHPCPKDYYRFTEQGLCYLCEKSSLKIKKIWSQGGPALVIFHAIELNLPELPRKLFLLLAPIFNKLDNRKLPDSVGWSLMAVK